jgi:signal peptidase II
MLVIIAIFVTFVRLGSPTALSVLAAGLVIGGALGNLLDRVRLAYVVDFIETYGVHATINNTLYTFPVFNVADSAITVGVILVLIGMFFGQPSEVVAPKAVTPPLNNNSTTEQDTDTKNTSLAER